jgi:hypothetical protein
MYELLKERHIKITAINKTKKKLQETKNTRNCSVIYSGVEQINEAQSGGTRTIFTSFGITEL